MMKMHMEMHLRSLPRRDMDHVLAHAELAWHARRGARFFILGESGVVGIYIF